MTAAGIKTLIDLRLPTEAKKKPVERVGTMKSINYISKPIVSRKQILGIVGAGIQQDPMGVLRLAASGGARQGLKHAVRQLDKFGQAGLNEFLVDKCGFNVGIVLKTIVDTPGPTLFFCSLGKDRTGLVAARPALASLPSLHVGE